jgi:hypothetical protein
MKKLLLASIVVLCCASAGLAQGICDPTSTLTDQERFVREEIRSRIDESIEAAEANDLPARMRYFAPDLTLRLVDGTVLDRKQIECRDEARFRLAFVGK